MEEYAENKIDHSVPYEHNRFKQVNMVKPLIKFMVITRYGSSQRHDIAFITADYKFYVIQMRFAQHIHHISYIHHDKINDVFRKFAITNETEILFQDTIATYSPIYLFFKILLPYVKFHMSMASLEKMVKRIYYFRPSFAKNKPKLTKTNVNTFLYKAWDKLIESEECPWITKNVDTNLKLTSAETAKYQKRVRICLFYMIVRRHLENKNKS